MGGLGVSPQQAVVAIRLFYQRRNTHPTTACSQEDRDFTGEKVGKTPSEENKQSCLLSPNIPPNFPNLYFEQ